MNYKEITLLSIFCTLVLIPNILTWSLQTPDSLAINILIILFSLSLSSKLRVGIFILLPFALLAPFEVIYISVFEQPSSAHTLGVLVETNTQELLSFLSGIGIKLVIVFIITVVFLSLTLYTSVKNKWSWAGRSRTWILSLCIIVGLLLFSNDYYQMKNEEEIAGFSVNNLITQGDGRLVATRRLIESFPAGIAFRLNSFYNQKRGLKDAVSLVEQFHFDSKQVPQTPGKEVHILVIGETGRADRWQLNGYKRETTPLLAAKEGVISFTNTITGWTWTSMSVPVIITRKNSQNTNAFFAEKSVVSAFKEAGFKTYWLSTQGPLGVHDSSTALHAQEADEVQYLNLSDYRGGNVFDEVLLAPTRKIIAKNEDKQFIVLHTLGSHYDYSNRYPARFDRFQPSIKNNNNASLHNIIHKQALNNSYDNSIIYTDYILSKLIDLLKSSDNQASLFYIADHGENLFDKDCKISGHGQSTEMDYRVASIWWNSLSFAEKNPEKTKLIRARRMLPLTTEHVFHTLLNIANIHFPDEDLTKSVANKEWKPSVRWTHIGLDFDQSTRDPICNKLTFSTNK